MNIEIGNATITSRIIMHEAESEKPINTKRITRQSVGMVRDAISLSVSDSFDLARISDTEEFGFHSDKFVKFPRKRIGVIGVGAIKMNPFDNPGLLFSGRIQAPSNLPGSSRANYLYDPDLVGILQDDSSDLSAIALDAAATLVANRLFGCEVQPGRTEVSETVMDANRHAGINRLYSGLYEVTNIPF